MYSGTEHSQTDRGKGILLAVVLALFCLSVYLYRKTPAWDLALFPLVAAGVLSLFFLSNSHKEWLIEHIGVLTAGVSIVLLVPTFFYWWIVNFNWAADDALVSETTLNVYAEELGLKDIDPALPMTLTVSHPQTAFVDEPHYDLDILLTGTPVLSPTQETTISVTLPIGVQMQGIAGQQDLQKGEIKLSVGDPNQPQEPLIYTNSGTFEGLRNANVFTITLPALPATSTAGINGSFISPLTIEGQRGFEVRRYVTSELNPNSLAIFLVATLIPVLATMIQSISNERREELRSKRKQEYGELWEQFQEFFLAEDLDEGGGARQQLAKMKDPRYRHLAVTEPGAGEEFLKFVKLDFSESEEASRILTMHYRWPKLWAMAYIMAADESRKEQAAHKKKIKQEILDKARKQAQYLYPSLEDDRLLQDRLAALEHDPVFQIPTTLLRWPKDRKSNERNGIDEVFASDDATRTDDMKLLRDGAFWGGSGVFQDLKQPNRSSIILAPPGSGRTAFARNLPEVQFEGAKVIAVYLQGKVSWTQITAAIAQQMVAIIGHNPTRIGRLSSSQRELLAYAMAVGLGARNVQAKITRYQREGIDRRESTGRQNNNDEEVARRHLQLLKRTVGDLKSQRLDQEQHNATGKQDLTDIANQDFLECVAMLGFAHLLLVFDTAAQEILWVRDFILNNVDAWHDAGIHFVVFVPDAARKISPSTLSNRYLKEIQWGEDDLEELLNSRLQRVPHADFAKGYLKDTDDFSYMVKHVENNPRVLIRLWRELVAGKVDITEQFDRSDIDSALQGIGYG